MKSIRNAVVGTTLLIIFMLVAVAWISAGRQDPPDDAGRDTARWLELSRSETHQIGELQLALARSDSAVQQLQLRVRPDVARVRSDAVSIRVDTLVARDTTVAYTVPGIRDTAHMSRVERPGVDLHPWLVPTFFVASWYQQRHTVERLDSLNTFFTAQHGRTMSLMALQDQRHRADSGAIHALQLENATLRHGHRCNRRCGIALGVLGTVSAAIALDRVRSSMNGRSNRPP